MLTVRYTVRQIADADLPTAVAADGTARPATAQELRDLGLVALGGGYYSCAERHEGVLVPDPTSPSGVRRAWQPHGLAFPGTLVAHGTPTQRAAMLPDAAKPHVLTPHGHVRHHWHGERRPGA